MRAQDNKQSKRDKLSNARARGAIFKCSALFFHFVAKFILVSLYRILAISSLFFQPTRVIFLFEVNTEDYFLSRKSCLESMNSDRLRFRSEFAYPIYQSNDIIN